MTTAALDTAAKKCHAAADGDLMICHRCGVEWPEGGTAPVCSPITWKQLRGRILVETNKAEASLMALRGVRSKGVAADVEAARMRFAELDRIRLLVDRCTTEQPILDLLSGKKGKAS